MSLVRRVLARLKSYGGIGRSYSALKMRMRGDGFNRLSSPVSVVGDGNLIWSSTTLGGSDDMANSEDGGSK